MSHYNKHPSGIECIDIVKHENFNIGNAIKYIWRRKNKGSEIEDLKKAIYYLELELFQVEKNQQSYTPHTFTEHTTPFQNSGGDVFK